MKSILILEDNEERAALIRHAISQLGSNYDLKVWRDAPSMIKECENLFSQTALISLDHDLSPRPGSKEDPGTGHQVAQFLGDYQPVCPVIVHSQNADRVWSMHNELRFAGWVVERAGGSGVDWSQSSWLQCARDLIANHPNSWQAQLPTDHASRFERMRLSLDGLGIGDAVGEMLCYRFEQAGRRITGNELPGGPWFHTDDTEMAISVVGVLKSHGFIDQDALAKRFARRFERDPERGYGKMTRIQLREMMFGAKWKHTAGTAFGGQGSMGNGSAMRVAPLGAYFADDLGKCASEAAASSIVTHTHPEGVAGAVAVAVGAASAWQLRELPHGQRVNQFFEAILRHTPDSQVRRGILLASHIPRNKSTLEVASALGNGSLVTAPDTVPLCIWMAAHYSSDFIGAIAQTIQAGGDCDTNAAIVGGIVALSVGREGIPTDWLAAREKIQF